jgi:hypothetical protein
MRQNEGKITIGVQNEGKNAIAPNDIVYFTLVFNGYWWSKLQ